MTTLNLLRTGAIAIAVAVAGTAAVSVAQTPGGHHMGGHGWHGRGEGGSHGEDWLLRGINLTDAQRTQGDQIRERHAGTIRPLFEQIHTKRDEVQALGRGTSFDETLVRQKLTEIAGLEATLMGETFQMRQETLAVLTPEQRTELEKRRAEFESKRQQFEGRQERMDGGPNR